jgi:hypothetical protein
VRHLEGFVRGAAAVQRLGDLIRANRRRCFQPPWPARRQSAAEHGGGSGDAYLDEARVAELEATRPLGYTPTLLLLLLLIVTILLKLRLNRKRGWVEEG